MMKKILIIEDDLPIGNALEETLLQAGYEVHRAYSGTEALLVLGQSRPDLVLLDLMLPGLSGEEVLPHIQGIPVIVMSAKADIDNKVQMLLGGAVDYVTKPFHTKELLARIAVHLRGAPHASSPAVLEHNGLTLDLHTHIMQGRKQAVRLTRTEYAILKLLMENPEQVVPKSLLLEHISQDTPDCTEASLKMHISNLRKKLREADDQDAIEAVWGIGFTMR